MQWTLELPLNWVCLAQEGPDEGGQHHGEMGVQRGKLSWHTHRCAAKAEQRVRWANSPKYKPNLHFKDDVANFGHSIGFTLSFNSENDQKESADQQRENEIAWPRMIFRVSSEDGWGRVFINGNN